MTPARLATVAAAAAGGLTAVFIATSGPGPTDRREWVIQFLTALVILGGPLAVAAGILARRVATAAQGDDLGERILGIATAGLSEEREEWGNAMQAELAGIDEPSERRRFDVGCLVAAFRTGLGRASWPVALGTGLLLAAETFAVSRATLAGGQSGIVGFTLIGPVVVLLALTFLTGLTTRSFRIALITGGIALLAATVGVFAVAMAEGSYWHDVAGVYVMDGDFPKEGISRIGAVLDPIGPPYLLLHLMFWSPWVVIGAAVGSRRRQFAGSARPSAAELKS